MSTNKVIEVAIRNLSAKKKKKKKIHGPDGFVGEFQQSFK